MSRRNRSRYFNNERCVQKNFRHVRQRVTPGIYALNSRCPRDGDSSSPSEKTRTQISKFTMPLASSTKTETGRGEPVPGVKSQEQQPIRLQVGETVFSTTRQTLCKESTYFQFLLSDRNQKLTNGSFFIDADPELFSYILRYLRHGIYPVLFSRSNGHDYATYLGIERLATDLRIERLTKWLVDKQYESAIKCAVSFERMKPSVFNWLSDTLPTRLYLSTDHINFLPDSNGRVWEVKKRFIVRPEAFLAELQGSRSTQVVQRLRASKDTRLPPTQPMDLTGGDSWNISLGDVQ